MQGASCLQGKAYVVQHDVLDLSLLVDIPKVLL